MLTHLLESRAQRERRPGGTAVSILAHTLVLAALVRATAHATAPPPAPEPAPTLTYTDVTPPPSAPPSLQPLPPNDASFANPSDALAPSIVAPVDIPVTLPEIDYGRAPVNADDFASGRRRQLGGVPGGTGTAPVGDVYNEWQVERPAAAVPGSRGPDYPDVLRQAGVEGLVIVQFVVDTTGRADLSTVQVVRSDHAFFTGAVKRALEGMRFIPAEVGQRKVPQRVMQPFQFTLNR